MLGFLIVLGFFLLSENLQSSLLLTDNYKLDETPTKNKCPFYMVFQVKI